MCICLEVVSVIGVDIVISMFIGIVVSGLWKLKWCEYMVICSEVLVCFDCCNVCVIYVCICIVFSLLLNSLCVVCDSCVRCRFKFCMV